MNPSGIGLTSPYGNGHSAKVSMSSSQVALTENGVNCPDRQSGLISTKR